MLPLRLLSEVYTTHMATSGQLEMYENQKPLPLLELYDARNPRQGLISLLKHALIQVLIQLLAEMESRSPEPLIRLQHPCLQKHPQTDAR